MHHLFYVSGVSSPVACPSCPTARFCSQQCAAAAVTDPASHCHLVCRCLSACNAAGLSDDEQSTLGYLFRSCSLLFASQAGDQSAMAKLAQIETLATYAIETAAQFRSETHLLRARELHGRVLHVLALIGRNSTPISLDFITRLLEKESVNSYGILAPLLPGAENEADRRLRGSGLYPLASRVNHECLPNAARFDDFDRTELSSSTAPGSNTALSLRALHALPAGEEVTQSYFPLTWSFLQRQERCREQYGFICRCPRCKEEATWPPEEQGAETEEDVVLVREMSSTVITNSMIDIPNGDNNDVADAGYIHVFLFKYVCPREGCGGTMAPMSQHQSYALQCNVCGKVRTEAEFLAELEGSG
ncbi:hypothetical protein Ndes2437B_g07227 [Nannochloris sp. 'desiccata']